MVCSYGPDQSTSDTKINGNCLPDNSRTAHFIKCGNYFPGRINSKNIMGIPRISYEISCWKRWKKNDNNLIVN